MGLLGSTFLVLGIFTIALITYANITGDWDTIMNNPVGSYVVNWINWILEMKGIRGQRLGSSTSRSTIIGQTMSDEEKRRLARLARFDNHSQDKLLGSMKEE